MILLFTQLHNSTFLNQKKITQQYNTLQIVSAALSVITEVYKAKTKKEEILFNLKNKLEHFKLSKIKNKIKSIYIYIYINKK